MSIWTSRKRKEMELSKGPNRWCPTKDTIWTSRKRKEMELSKAPT